MRSLFVVALSVSLFAATAAAQAGNPALPLPVLPPAAAPAPAPAVVAPGPSGHWSINTGETVSAGRDALSAELGWPSMTFGYAHGLNDVSDIGLKFDLLYGYEGESTFSKLGLGLRVPFRFMALRRDRFSLQLHIEPVLRFYPGGYFNGVVFGAPVGATLGLQILPELRAALGIDLNLDVATSNGHGASLLIGPAFGFDLEYLVDKQLLVGVDTRFGPLIDSASGGYSDFAFRTYIVVGYRL